jgi:hypothetical protein
MVVFLFTHQLKIRLHIKDLSSYHAQFSSQKRNTYVGGLGHMIAPPSPKVIFYRKLVPLKEYHNMMIPIAASGYRRRIYLWNNSLAQ